jgi:PKD repeat protein
VFDVLLDGTLVLDDLDLSNSPGHDIGTMRSFDIVSDGTVDIDFVHGVDNPLINGIEIIDRNVSPTNNLGEQDEVRKLTWSGAGVPTVEPVANTTVPWQTVRGAFQVNATLFTFHADGSLMRRSFNTSGFGAGTVVDGWANTMMADMPNLGGVFYDPASSSIFYTVAGDTNLYRRGFLPESGVLHAVRSTVTTGNVAGLAPARVRGMFLSGGRLYFADATSGDLSSIAWSNGAPTGAVQLEEGTADWRARALFLAVGSTPNIAPTAVISPPTCVDNACEFSGTGSSDPDGTIVSFDWDFGDGGIPRTGADTSYAYGAAGTYTVTLTVTDDDGDVDTAELDVTVGDPPNDPPTAVATASCSGATCSFSGAGSSDPDGTIAGYLWDFGDGATATGVTVTRTFTASGTYTVELIVTDDDGDEAVTSVDVTVTVTGPPTGPIPIVPLDPARLLETRTGPDDTTIDGQAQGIGRRTAGSITELTVTNRAGVPANATAVMINLTAVLPDGNGFLTAFPCGTDQPNASSVNYAPGQVVPNAVLAKIGTNGRICIFTLAATDILVDVTGYVPAGGSPTPIDPARLLETRTGPDDTTIDGQAQGIGRRTAGSITELTVTNRAGVPANATAVMINLTAVLPDGNGFLTAFPCGTDQPNASSVNYAPGQVVPNAVLAKIGTNGRICIYTLAATDILVDVTGYVPAGGSPTPIDPGTPPRNPHRTRRHHHRRPSPRHRTPQPPAPSPNSPSPAAPASPPTPPPS